MTFTNILKHLMYNNLFSKNINYSVQGKIPLCITHIQTSLLIIALTMHLFITLQFTLPLLKILVVLYLYDILAVCF